MRGGPKATRDQILNVYRLNDADTAAGQPEYYVRLRGAPLELYSLGCGNLLQSLAWTKPDGSDLMDVTTPINRSVLQTWTDQEVAVRPITCNAATRRPLPPAPRDVSVKLVDDARGDQATLYKVKAFPGIPTRAALYLISNGLGYGIDCGSNVDDVKAAFGFSATDAIPELSNTSEIYTHSHPEEQPILRCAKDGVALFDPIDTAPRLPYFRPRGAKALVQFTCTKANRFFSAGVTDIRAIPSASAPYLLVDNNFPDVTTRTLRVGCKADAPRTPLELGPQYWIEPDDWTATPPRGRRSSPRGRRPHSLRGSGGRGLRALPRRRRDQLALSDHG